VKFTVRPAAVPAEREEILALLERNLPMIDHRRRFEWLYLENPAGPARSWFVADRGRPVGVASVFPRFLWVGGKLERAGQVGDFAVDRGYRALGPATALQRATFEAVDRGDLALCYDCPPHEAGLATFRRMGMGVDCLMLRYVKLIRADRALRRRMGGGPAVRLAAAAANVWLRVVERPRRNPAGLEVVEHSGEFGAEFDELDRRNVTDNEVRSARTSEFLNWRYRRDPLSDYEVLAARRAGHLVGFGVLRHSSEDVVLLDLFSDPEPHVVEALLDPMVQRAHCARVQTLTAIVSQGDGLGRRLRTFGFRCRGPAERVVAYPAGRFRPPRWSFRSVDVVA
jgi:hypothetical protein